MQENQKKHKTARDIEVIGINTDDVLRNVQAWKCEQARLKNQSRILAEKTADLKKYRRDLAKAVNELYATAPDEWSGPEPVFMDDPEVAAAPREFDVTVDLADGRKAFRSLWLLVGNRLMIDEAMAFWNDFEKAARKDVPNLGKIRK